MSWNIGKDDISEQTQAFKNKLSSKESECAALQSQLLKRNAEFDELKSTLHDTLHKLSREADRALRLEKDFKQCSQDLVNEKNASQNIQAALSAAQDRIKQEELAAKDLQATIDLLSYKNDGSNARTTKLEQEKAVAEARVRELEANLRQATTEPPAPPMSRIPSRNGRKRSSSVSPSLQQELNDVRAVLSKKETDLRLASEKLSRTQADLTKVSNEKIAMEKRMQSRIEELKTSLDDREEELEYLKEGQGDGGRAREEELLQRVEEDEAKIMALETLLRDGGDSRQLKQTLKKVEAKLTAEVKRVADAEARQIELVKEKEQALDELENAHDETRRLERVVTEKEASIEALGVKIRGLQHRFTHLEDGLASQRAVMPPSDHGRQANEEAVTYIERLLGAIDRLRDERDNLKRDLSFLETEFKFATEALDAQRESNSHGPQDDSRQVVVDRMDKHMRRLDLTATASMVIIQHLLSGDDNPSELASLRSQLKHLTELCAERDCDIAASAQKLTDMEDQLKVAVLDLEAAVAQRSNLYSQIKKLEGKETVWAAEAQQARDLQKETQEALELAEAQIEGITKTLGDVESERDSHMLQLTNLQSDLHTVQEELTQAQSRYSALQFHQLSSMSSNDAVQVLRAQIEELDMRVMRRTEQIGIHQHDIKRLETNLKLSEERVGELMSEVEILSGEKEAMVEDCAAAREARDEAIEKSESLEMEVEALEGNVKSLEAEIQEFERQREQEVTALVGIAVVAAGQSRAARTSASINDARLCRAEASQRRAMEDLQHLTDEYRIVAEQRCSTALMLEAMRSQMEISDQDVKQVTLALAVSQVEVNSLKEMKDNLQEQLTLERTQYSEADTHAKTLHKEIIQDLETKLHNLERVNEEMLSNHQAAVSSLVQSREELQERLIESERMHAGQNLEEELQSLRSRELEAREDLRRKLEETEGQLADIRSRYEDVSASSQQASVALEAASRTKEDLENRLAEATTSSLVAHNKVEEEITRNKEELNDLRHQLDQSSHQARQLEQRLKQESDSHVQEQLLHNREADRYRRAESMLAELRLQVAGSRDQLEAMRVEKTSLQMEMTNLEAEIQRSISLRRYLENQVQDSERTTTALNEAVDAARAESVRSDTAAKMAQMQLAFEKSEHEQKLSSLHRELTNLRRQPKLEERVAELEEQNRQMDDMLRTKCAEIEENDDRFIEMLKEKKKLTTKIESLTRKVQVLQTKIATAKTCLPSSASEPVVSTGPDRPSPKETISVPPVPPMPVRTEISTPAIRTRVPSTPSSFPRPKTPERRTAQPTVFRPRTPEPRRTPDARPMPTSTSLPSVPPAPSSTSSRRKRPLSEDHYTNIPPQGFDANSTPRTNEPVENSTPRMRKISKSVHSGFTPVRNNSSSRPTVALPSPRRKAHGLTQAPRQAFGIADVTNSPVRSAVQEQAQTKRSWLTKIRGVSSRTGVGEPPGGAS